MVVNLTRILYHNSNSIRQVATLIDGKRIAHQIQNELKSEISQWSSNSGKRPMLVAILVGDDPASATYVAHKVKTARLVGVDSTTETYPSHLTENDLLERINYCNNDDNVDGILVQLPLPRHINSKLICQSIHCDKDVDGFNSLNMGKLSIGGDGLFPCTPLGVIELLKRSDIPIVGKNAVVCGRSKNVGLPIALLLQNEPLSANVTICHGKTPKENFKKFCTEADIIVAATGLPGLITAEMVKPGACVIDVGITRVTDKQTGKTKLIGDVDFERVKDVAGSITPVPGGVGPMTVTMLMKNTFLAARRRLEKTGRCTDLFDVIDSCKNR